jgi:hypothetical protein
MSPPEPDPEVFQAITDLRPVYAAWRKAKADAKKLHPVTRARHHAAATAEAGDQFSIMRTRAEGRLNISVDALVVILAADAALAAKFKRRPSRQQLGKALGEECGNNRARDVKAKASLERAEREAAAAARALEAAHQARLAITGYGS